MNIGKVSKLTNLTVKTIRYYDIINLVKPYQNKLTGYRDYSNEDISKLMFVGKARRFNFSINECKELLSLYEDKNRSSKEVKKITLEKIKQIDNKLNDLNDLKQELTFLAKSCKGNERPDCPILDALSRK